MPFPFLQLPAEIREQIYREILHSENNKIHPPKHFDVAARYNFDFAILRANRLIHHEAQKVFQENVFILITTPWEQSIQHISTEGKVPMVSRGRKAVNFKGHHLHIAIDAVESPANGEEVSMIITLPDLPSFTQMWRFSELNYRESLNSHLSLSLNVQDPNVPSRKLPKDLQERLLFPFADIKNLAKFSIDGPKILPSVLSRLAERRAIPEDRPEECIQKANELKDVGNDLLTAGKPFEAIQKYIDSFSRIHITVKNRLRTVHADGFFCQDITEGPYKGSRADYLRMILRVQLVSNIVLCYLRLFEWEEAYFWGKRTIILFRQSMRGFALGDLNDNFISSSLNTDSATMDILTGGLHSEDQSLLSTPSMQQRFLDELVITQFPAQDSMGKIFFRTALAARQMGKMADVKVLIRAASVYLPKNEKVQAEKRKLDVEEDEKRRTEGEAVF